MDTQNMTVKECFNVVILFIIATLIYGGFLHIVTILAIGFYFLPSIVAHFNRKKNLNAIILANLFTGWTLLGWVITLIWATLKD